MSFSRQKEIGEILCESGTPVTKASAIWLHTIGGDRGYYKAALYIFETQVTKGFYNSPKERFEQLLLRSRSGDNTAKREAIDILIACLESYP